MTEEESSPEEKTIPFFPDHIWTEAKVVILIMVIMMKYVPKTIGVLIPIIGLVLIVIWPFLDRKGDTLRARNVRWIIVIVGSIVVIGLTIMGALS
jgi:quinol-cytochrome oxidoreductase complex cytochrome b subunit